MKLLNVVGARPNFIKIAPVVLELQNRGIEQVLVHTGQHYDEQMSQIFFDELSIPRPDIDLGVGSASHAVQTAEVMIRFDEVIHDIHPDCVVVVGDVNSTLACALTAVKLHYPVAHIESGLRSRDRRMPEEINRIVTDHISDFLFTPSGDADANLRREGIESSKVHCVGNIMIDSLLAHRKQAKLSNIVDRLNLLVDDYAVVTMHRPDNVDDKKQLKKLCDIFVETSSSIPIVWPIHPRSRQRLSSFGLLDKLESNDSIILCEPLGYLDFMSLVDNSRFVMTDSGGLQEETTVFGIPCLTLRENTERPVTIDMGTNLLVGTDRDRILAEVAKIIEGRGKSGKTPPLWDGKSAKRIVDILANNFN